MVEFKLIDNIKDVTNELFSNVIIYIIAEPGAMGFPRLMEFVAESGECFYLVYGNEKGEIPYSIIKSSFRALQDCFWNAFNLTFSISWTNSLNFSSVKSVKYRPFLSPSKSPYLKDV